MQESEVTVKVLDDLKTITEKLKNKGFSVIREVNLDDYYYSGLKDDTLSYKEMINKSILIRELSGSEYSVQMMYKNKIFDENGNVVLEEKVKCNVDDFSKARKVFDLAGLHCWCHLKNNSFIYKNGNMEFALQNVEGLGIFIEYEQDDSMKNLELNDKLNLMIHNVRNLGLSLGEDFFVKKVEIKYLNDKKGYSE